MKTLLLWVIWISGISAGILILIGVFAVLLNVSVFGVGHTINFFHVANSFLLMSICTMIYKKVTYEN